MKIHSVYRVIKGPLGAGYAYPVKVFDDQRVAEEALQESAQFMAAVTEGNIIVGMRKVMSVKQLLVELGVGTISHSVLTQEVHGSVILTPTAGIIRPA